PPNETVEAPQERGQGLAAAGGGVDERVLPPGDRRPAARLRRRGRFEGIAEPGSDGRRERGQGVRRGGRVVRTARRGRGFGGHGHGTCKFTPGAVPAPDLGD